MRALQQAPEAVARVKAQREADASAAAGRGVGWGDPPAWPGALHIRLSQLTLVRKLLHGGACWSLSSLLYVSTGAWRINRPLVTMHE